MNLEETKVRRKESKNDIDVEKILIPYSSFDYQSHSLNRMERRKKERMNKKRKK